MSPWFLTSKRRQSIQEQPSQRSPTQSLLHYETGSPPPSARVDPKLKLQPRRPLRLWDYWKFAAIVATKATEVTTDVLSHHIWGPRRKSWGIEMTIVTSLIRGAERHSALVDIGTIRMLMGIGGLVPLPSDALVSPVTFRVKKRNLRGILANFDAKEDGQRELCGEWVVGLKTWQRMQTEWKASNKSDPKSKRPMSNDSFTANASAPTESSERKERVILYIHGGAYYLSSAAAQRIISIPLAKYTDSRVFALNYRLAPETCFPGPLHDAVSAYFRLTEELHIPPENVILCGDSAGGGLCLALLMYLRDNGYSLPSGAILMSPWVDLTMSCESWDSNAPYDVVPFPTADNHMNPIALYLGENTEEYLTHPYASPLFGDFKGLPPLLVHAGDAEVLRDEIALLAHKATLAGVQVMHELYEDAIHVFQAYPFLAASRQSFESMRNFVRTVLPQYQCRSPQLLAAIAERGMEQEIGTDRSIVVGGDGVEAPISYDKAQNFGKDRNFSSDRGVSGSQRGIGTMDEYLAFSADSYDEPSWVQSPMSSPHITTSSWKGKATHDKGSYEHLEDINVEDIPDMSLSTPVLHSPMPRRTPSISYKRPTLSATSSSMSTKSSSSLRTPNSPTVISPPCTAERPKRIQSTSSLLAFTRGHERVHGNSNKHAYPEIEHSRSPSSHWLSFDSFKPSFKSHSRSHSGTLIPHGPSKSTSYSNTHPNTSAAPPSPSIRKRKLSSGLTMSSKRGKNNTAEWLTDNEAMADMSQSQLASITIAKSTAATDNVQALVDQWSRSGPANKTVMISAQSLS